MRIAFSLQNCEFMKNFSDTSSMSTLLVTSGFIGVIAAVAAGISPSMAPSAAHLGLLKARST